MALDRHRLNTFVTLTLKEETVESTDDIYGNKVPVETVSQEWAEIQPQQNSELKTDRDTRLNGFTGLFAPESLIDALSEISWTDTFGVAHTGTIEGEPVRHSTMRGPHSITVSIQEIVG